MNPTLSRADWLDQVSDEIRRLVAVRRYEDADEILERTAMLLFDRGYRSEAAAYFESMAAIVPTRHLTRMRRGYRLNLRGLISIHRELSDGKSLFLQALAISQKAGSPELEAIVSLNLGAWAQTRDDDDEARTWYSRALEATTRAGDATNALKVMVNLAFLDLSANRLEDAERRTEAAAELATAVNPSLHTPPQIEALRGHILRYRGDLVGAEAAYRRTTAGARREGRDDLANVSLQWTGAVLMEQGNWGNALRYLRRSLRLAYDRRAPSDIDVSARTLAVALYQRGRSHEAVEVLAAARRNLRSLEAPASWGHVVVEAALLDGDRGEFVRAERALRSVLPTLLDWGAKEWITRAARGLVEIAARRQTGRALVRAVAFVRQLSPRLEPHLTSDILEFAGRHLAVLGDESAFAVLSESLDFAHEAAAPDVPMQAARAAVALHIARMDRHALAMFDRAAEESISRQDMAARMLILNDRGILLHQMERYEDAENSLLESKRLAASRRDRVAEARADFNLAEVYRRWDRLKEAERYARRALSFSKRRDDSDGVAEATNQLALVLTDLGRFDEARSLYERARELTRESGSRHSQADAEGGLARLLFVAGRYTEAARKYAAAADLNVDDRGTTHHVEDLAGVLESHSAAHAAAELRGAAQAFVSACQDRGTETFGADSFGRAAQWWLRDDLETAAFLYALSIALAGLGHNANRGARSSVEEVSRRMVTVAVQASAAGIDVGTLRRRLEVQLNSLHRGLGRTLAPLLDTVADAVRAINMEPLPSSATSGD